MDAGSVSPQLLAIFAHLVEEACGVRYGPHDRAIFAAKLEAHAAELGKGSLLDYYYLLRYDDPGHVELDRLIEAILVHETYYFRELPPLVHLADELAAIVASRGSARVWSCACSTGEEAFTLAMLLDGRGILGQVEIVASDISATAIARAITGRHGERSLREGCPEDLAARYLTVGTNGVAVAPVILDAVRFATINLLDDNAIGELGLFDVILCRNVLIYFSDPTVLRVVASLVRSLEPAGVIAVGVAESLLRLGTALACEQRGGSFFYRSVA